MKWFLIVLFFSLSLFASPDKSLIIVTSNSIKQDSANLQKFIAEKEKRGFSVLLATEDDFGGDGVKGQKKAVLIREWLKNIYKDYSFLLLIGDPHPKYGEIPIAQAIPRGEDAPDICERLGLICNVVETDNFYSDLDGSWDGNENGVYGEYEFDFGENGIDYSPELIVGRLPVHYDDVDELDKILDNIIRYMNETKSGTKYRFKTMFASTFVWFEGYNNMGTIREENKDTAEVSEWIIHNVLSQYEETSYTRLYEEEGVVSSQFEYERALTKENFIDEWNNGYGTLFWFGHGQPTAVARTIWYEDKNDNQKGENDEVISVAFLESGDGDKFKGEKPAFVVAESCEVGSIEVPGNITSMLLLHNAAIGIISASNVSDDSNTDWSNVDNAIDEYSYGIEALASYVIQGLLDGESGGAIFAQKRYELAMDTANKRIHENKLMINYFGDPTLTLYDSVEDIIEDEISDESEVNDEDSILEEDDDEFVGNNSSSGCSIISVIN